jgi:hypothetical protein
MKTVFRSTHKADEKSSGKTVENGGKVGKTPPEKSQETPSLAQNSVLEDRKNLRVLRFFVNEDGAIDFARMHGKTVEELKAFVKRPEVRKNLEIESSVSKEGEKDDGFGTMEANALLDLLSVIEVPVASKLYGVPIEVAREAFVFKPEVREKINPSMIKLLNKWGPAIAKTWKDEVGFVLVMGTALNIQIQTMHALESKRKAKPAENTSRIIPIRPGESETSRSVPPPVSAPVQAPPAPLVQGDRSQIKLSGKESLDLDSVGFEL